VTLLAVKDVHGNERRVKFKAYNLGRGKGMSVLQIVEAMRKATGFDYGIKIIGRR
jgi:UDP-glucose 4-epimerase